MWEELKSWLIRQSRESCQENAAVIAVILEEMQRIERLQQEEIYPEGTFDGEN